jgi:ATP-dependent Lon protease
VQFDSAYYDPDDPSVPQYIKKLFQDGAPADFVLIGATTRSPEEISPALRSRCAEIFFDPLTPTQIVEIAEAAARRLGVSLEVEAADLVARYTLEGRRAVALLADAYGLALLETEHPTVIGRRHVSEAVAQARLPRVSVAKASPDRVVGRVFGLAVAGFQGTVLEVEAAAFPAREPGKGQVRFNETAGTMTKDSVFNALTVLRELTNQDPLAYDFHVNVVGGGQVDGPSAGAAIFLALYSVVQQVPLPQDVAVTGEIALSGQLKPVGGVPEKVFGARQAAMRAVVVPEANRHDVPPQPGIDVWPVADARGLVEALTR